MYGPQNPILIIEAPILRAFDLPQSPGTMSEVEPGDCQLATQWVALDVGEFEIEEIYFFAELESQAGVVRER